MTDSRKSATDSHKPASDAEEEARRAGLRAWIEHWKRVGPELERIKREELRRYKHEENIEIIDALLQMGIDHAQPRTTSGLVELQRILHRKLRR